MNSGSPTTVTVCPSCGQPNTAADLYPDQHHPACVPTLETLRRAWNDHPDHRAAIETAARTLGGAA